VDVNAPSQQGQVGARLRGERPQQRDTTAPRELLDRAVRKAGIPAKLARELQITPSHVNRRRRGACGFGIGLTLRLVRYLDEDGVTALRGCGHVQIAHLLQKLRSHLLQPGRLKGSPNHLHDAIDRLSRADRAMVSTIVNRLLVGSSTRPPLPTPGHEARRWR
jgi:hypothetical protein